MWLLILDTLAQKPPNSSFGQHHYKTSENPNQGALTNINLMSSTSALVQRNVWSQTFRLFEFSAADTVPQSAQESFATGVHDLPNLSIARETGCVFIQSGQPVSRPASLLPPEGGKHA